MSVSRFETMFLEERRYTPPADFAAQASAPPEIYDEDFETFWEREGRDRLHGQQLNAKAEQIQLSRRPGMVGLVRSRETQLGTVHTLYYLYKELFK